MENKKQRKTIPKVLRVILLTGCSIVLFTAAAFFIIRWPVTSTEAYKDAIRRVRTNPVLLEELGAPISAGWWIKSSGKTQGASEILEFSLSISGTKKSGVLTVRARLLNREWSFDLVEAKIEGRIDPLDLNSRSR